MRTLTDQENLVRVKYSLKCLGTHLFITQKSDHICPSLICPSCKDLPFCLKIFELIEKEFKGEIQNER